MASEGDHDATGIVTAALHRGFQRLVHCQRVTFGDSKVHDRQEPVASVEDVGVCSGPASNVYCSRPSRE